MPFEFDLFPRFPASSRSYTKELKANAKNTEKTTSANSIPTKDKNPDDLEIKKEG